jgi:ligand-binding sensor domain-containing protein/putative methionine-R-sulfoxide reductase with GAF domain
MITVVHGKGQSILFSHLNTSDGLSDNYARSIAIDNNGFLWIGTSNGLNMYDGATITSYFVEQQPDLASNTIAHLICDSHNRIWLGTSKGATWIDENREFHRVRLKDGILHYHCPSIFEAASYGTIVYTSGGQYFFDSTRKKWLPIDWIPASLSRLQFVDAEPFSNNAIIFTLDSMVAILDYATRKIIYQQTFQQPVSACPVSLHEIAIGMEYGQVLIVDIVSGKTVRQYNLTNELNGKAINTHLTEVRRAANGDLLVATDFAGLIIIDQAGHITRHTHDPINAGSIAANNTYRAFAGKKGEVVVGTYTSGVSMGNIYNKPAGYTRIFKDDKGNLFDNYLNKIAEEGNGVFWIGSYDRLIRWDRNKNQSNFYYYYYQGATGVRALEIRALCNTTNGVLLAGLMGNGLCVFDKRTGRFRKLSADTSQGPAVTAENIYDLQQLSDGSVWVASSKGLYTVDANTLKVSGRQQDTLFKTLSGKTVLAIYEDRRHRIWIGTMKDGLYCFDRRQATYKQYDFTNVLISSTVYAIAEDKSGSVYAATPFGFAVVTKNGQLQNYTKKEGLRYERCESLLADDSGNIWIANNKCLLKFHPDNKRLEYFEDNSGLTVHGFRTGACFKAANGELLWGSQSGINYFFPDQLLSTPWRLQLSLSGIEAKDTLFRFSKNRDFSFPYSRNDISFHFAAINISGSRDIEYQYKLDGYDKEWHSGVGIREAHYTSLPPGKYVFNVKASIDRVNWTKANNTVTISITPPIWQRGWFVATVVLLVTGTIYWYVQNRNRKIKTQKELLETEQAINYFASGMNEQQHVEDILWDVAKNCIGRLHFEDCVIYLVDEKRNVLTQKAAHGPKSPEKNEIYLPIEIPLGKGIVGSVAITGKAEIISDTSQDPRYIVDDQLRYSEITVPILSHGKVLGVIDCEHSEKNFFTIKHLSILTTIASLCANKIVRAIAEEEKETARVTLLQTQQKMAEVEMQALRAQMNPHFIFNCLNSINRYIVKSDQATASLYLTKFAKLIRLILDNSNSKNVILSNELEALKLYIDMEALRFDKKFSYEIKVDSNVGPDSIEVPPLIIQPYVENAIWHGLLHKQTVGHLKIHISMPDSNMLQCVIEDNGIGRAKAKELKSKSAITKKSLGLKLTENRLALLNKHAELNASVEIIDLVEGNAEPAGTRVILKMPI